MCFLQIWLLCVRATWCIGLLRRGRTYRCLQSKHVKRPRTFQVINVSSIVQPCRNKYPCKFSMCFFFRSTKNFQKKYGLSLTAATFLIIDYSDASMEIACEWQKCIGDTINLVSPLKCGSDDNDLDGKKK